MRRRDELLREAMAASEAGPEALNDWIQGLTPEERDEMIAWSAEFSQALTDWVERSLAPAMCSAVSAAADWVQSVYATLEEAMREVTIPLGRALAESAKGQTTET